MWFYYLLLILVQKSLSKSIFEKLSLPNKQEQVEDFLADAVNAKGHLPNVRNLSKPFVMRIGNDVTYLLSKLSDDELIRVLNNQPKKHEYDLSDIIKVAKDAKASVDSGSGIYISTGSNPRYALHKEKKPRNNLKTVSEDNFVPQLPYFRLNNKPLINKNNKVDPSYKALQKINSLLNKENHSNSEDEDDKKKELLFDILVAQLKKLCCNNKRQRNKAKNEFPLEYLLSDHFKTPDQTNNNPLGTENMFLVINDDIKSNSSDEVILVDPDSLDKNSTVLLLGPITTPLSDEQLKQAMRKISNELSKPDYLPLLQQLADGTITNDNIKLVKSLVSGPETRRYIKPHRCNHQSKLAKIYGGPKWLICTGYLNINVPSLYDR